MRRRAALRPMVEILAMAGLLSSYIWGWVGSFEGNDLLLLMLYFMIGISGHLRRREGPEELGLRLDNWSAAARNSVRFVVPMLLLPLLLGAPLGSIEFPPIRQWPVSLLGGAVWATLQQYGLLCVFYRRFCEILEDERARMFATGIVFAFFHLPNPFLSIVTLGAGALSCWLYRRAPNLLVIGLTHSITTFVIVHSLPATVTFGMRVGPGFFRFQPNP